jgi:hypothetical protein
LIAELEGVAARHCLAFEEKQREARVNLERLRNNYSVLNYSEEAARIIEADAQ